MAMIVESDHTGGYMQFQRIREEAEGHVTASQVIWTPYGPVYIINFVCCSKIP